MSYYFISVYSVPSIRKLYYQKLIDSISNSAFGCVSAFWRAEEAEMLQKAETGEIRENSMQSARL